MYNTYVNFARQNALVVQGNINARIEAVYDANCASYVYRNGSRLGGAFDDCSAVRAAGICERAAVFTNTSGVRLQSLCNNLNNNTGRTFYSFTNEEICTFVRNETCSDEAAIADVGSFSNIFCIRNGTFVKLRERCLVLRDFEICGETVDWVNLWQGAFIIATMCLYGYLSIVFGRLDGDDAQFEIKRLFAKRALASKKRWLPQWRLTYNKSFNEPPETLALESDIILAAFASFEASKLAALCGRSHKNTYEFPAFVGPLFHRVVAIIIVFVIVLVINLLALVSTIGASCRQAFSWQFAASCLLYVISFFFCAVYMCFNNWRNMVGNRPYALNLHLMCDKVVQQAILTNQLPITVDEKADYDGLMDSLRSESIQSAPASGH